MLSNVLWSLSVYADIAPDPIHEAISFLPIFLVLAVVALAVFLIRKFFKKQ
ncbi:MAG: hypothetical protein IJI46_10845 [Erysipelotrichaceae bacterium]|nr:hypothetical protein [Erysipelotrichaceae bacterium]